MQKNQLKNLQSSLKYGINWHNSRMNKQLNKKGQSCICFRALPRFCIKNCISYYQTEWSNTNNATKCWAKMQNFNTFVFEFFFDHCNDNKQCNLKNQVCIQPEILLAISNTPTEIASCKFHLYSILEFNTLFH